VFTIAGVYAVNPQTRQSTGSLQQFVVTADLTASSTGTLSISPAIYTADHALATFAKTALFHCQQHFSSSS
jgi:hypothetical protein